MVSDSQVLSIRDGVARPPRADLLPQLKTIVVCCPTASVGRALAARLAGRVRLAECSTAAELLPTLIELRAACAVCELPSDLRECRRTVRVLRQFVDAAPDHPVIVVCTLGRYTAAAIIAASHAGVRTVVLHPYDNIALAVRRSLRNVNLIASSRRAMAHLGPHMSASARRIVRHCLRRAHRGPTVSSIASALGVCRRTLERQCRAAGLPLPEELIAWCRLIMVLEIAKGRRGTLDQVSKRFGFQGAADVRTKLKRRTGMTLRQVRELGGLTDLFKERLLLQRRVLELELPRRTPLDVEAGGSVKQLAP